MNDQAFEELLDSLREGGAILRGEKQSSRWFEFTEPDVNDLGSDTQPIYGPRLWD